MSPSLLMRKEDTRRRIVDTAARLFLEKGVDRVGVDEIMRECGLTHGGFYGYFRSKAVLVSEACAAALEETAGQWQALARKLGDDALWQDFLATYLAGGLAAANNPASPAAILGADVARRPDAIQAKYVSLIRQLIGEIEAEAGAGRGHAILIFSALVGATSLAAQVRQDKALAREILDTTRDQLIGRRREPAPTGQQAPS